MTTPQNRRLKRDIELPESSDSRLFVSVSGDLRVLEGRTNVISAARRRALTARTSMTHRPEYGGDLPLYIEEPLTPSTFGRLSVDVRRNLLRDTRLESATVSAGRGTPADPDAADAMTVGIELRIRGNDDTDETVLSLEA